MFFFIVTYYVFNVKSKIKLLKAVLSWGLKLSKDWTDAIF